MSWMSVNITNITNGTANHGTLTAPLAMRCQRKASRGEMEGAIDLFRLHSLAMIHGNRKSMPSVDAAWFCTT